jgi:hypothetical protein
MYSRPNTSHLPEQVGIRLRLNFREQDRLRPARRINPTPTDADGMERNMHRLMRYVLGSDTKTVGHNEVFSRDRRIESRNP